MKNVFYPVDLTVLKIPNKNLLEAARKRRNILQIDMYNYCMSEIVLLSIPVFGLCFSLYSGCTVYILVVWQWSSHSCLESEPPASSSSRTNIHCDSVSA